MKYEGLREKNIRIGERGKGEQLTERRRNKGSRIQEPEGDDKKLLNSGKNRSEKTESWK